MIRFALSFVLLGAMAACGTAETGPVTVTLHAVSGSGVGSSLGTVQLRDTRHGLELRPELRGLSSGRHGFHVHEHPSCAPGRGDGKPSAAASAGGHYDPDASDAHGLPWGDGHLGDLPALYVDPDGSATRPMLAPRLRLADIRNRALVVHAGGDNHADSPEPLGGGGARVACGVIAGES